MDETALIGKKLRQLRIEKEMTLKDLANKVNLTTSHISQIENNKTVPSIPTLMELAKALDVSIIEFFADELLKEPKVMNKREWTNVLMPGWDAEVWQLVRIIGSKRMQPLYTVVPPGGGSRDGSCHPGEEFLVVIEGELTLTIADHVYKLGPMTSSYYSSLLPHTWKNEGTEPCRIFWVVSPPSW